MRLRAPVAAAALAGAALTGALTGLLAPSAGVAAEQVPDEPADGPAAVSVLHDVRPSVLTADDAQVELSGTVRNSGDEPLHNVQVVSRFSRVAVADRSDIQQLDADQSLYRGRRFSEAYEVLDEVLEPGEEQPFALPIPTELLSFDAAGVYVVGVSIMGTSDSGDRLELSVSRTVLPWLPDGADLPAVRVAMLWPLAARPSTLPDETLLDETLAGQLGPDGPLTSIVEAAAETPVTWVVDPDLLDTVRVMADGFQVATPSGPVDGAQADSAAAEQWRLDFNRATRDSDMFVLPYAAPDIAALAAAQPQLAAELAGRAYAAAEEEARSIGADSSALAWLDDGALSDETLTTLAAAGAESAVVPGGAVGGTGLGPFGEVTIGEHTLNAVLADAGLSDAVADAATAEDSQAGAVDVRQRWAAETAMIAMAGDDDALVAAPPLRWRPDAAVAEAVVGAWTSIPWIEPVGLSDLENTEQRTTVPAQTDRAARAEPAAPSGQASALPTANVTATERLHDLAGQYTSLLADPDDMAGGLGLATVRSASTGWRDDPDAGVAYTTAIADQLSTQFGEVSVTVPESVTLSSRTGSFPLTVANDLPQAVNVKLDIHSANVDRLRIEDVPLTRVEPGERLLIEVTAQAAANGRVPINVQLTTNSGDPLGRSLPTVVNATDYGTIGWVIVGAAGALFATTIVRHSLRRRRARHASSTHHDAATATPSPAPDVSAPDGRLDDQLAPAREAGR